MTRLTRRQILRLGALAGVSASTLPLLEACASGTGSASTTAPAVTATGAPATAAAISGSINVMTWNSATDQRQACIDEFMKEYPAVAVKLVTYPSATWQQNFTATLVAGTPVVDAGIIKEEVVASWIAAGFIQPMDGLPGLDNIKKAMYPGALADCTYGGKVYGLPYYSNFCTWVSNKKVLNAAGITTPATTWDDLKTQAQQIKKSGMNLPIAMGFAANALIYLDWPSLVYASGGNLFDQDDNPVFDGADPIPLEIMNRILDLKQSGLLDPKSSTLQTGDIDTAFQAGQYAMAPTLVLYGLDYADPKASKVAGQWMFSSLPSLNGTMKGTCGFTRQYVLGAKTTQRDAAWQWLSFMAGQDKSGGYFAPTYLLTQAALLSGLAPVMASPQAQAYMQQLYPDTKVIAAQQAIAKPRQALKTVWYPQWDIFNQTTLQDVVAGKTSPADGLKASAQKARDLKKA